MPLVELRHRITILEDLAVTWSDRLPALRELPEATIDVPRCSPAYGTDAIAEAGGTVVRIYHEGEAWLGIGDVPESTESGLRLRAYSPLSWLDIRHVGEHRVFFGCCAGTIARAALIEGIGGLPGAPIVLGAFCEAPPHLDEFRFEGQSVLDALIQLAELTGQEFYLDDQLRFWWVPWRVTWRNAIVTDADGLLGDLPGDSLQEQAREVHEVRRGIGWTVYDLRVPSVWPRAVSLRSG